MTNQIDSNKYVDFVRQTTSPESLDYAALLTRLNKLELSDFRKFSVLQTCGRLVEFWYPGATFFHV